MFRKDVLIFLLIIISLTFILMLLNFSQNLKVVAEEVYGDHKELLINFYPDGNLNYAQKHSLEVNVTEGEETIEQLLYQWTSNETYPSQGVWNSIENNELIHTPNNKTGDYYLHVKVVDNQGNVKQKTSNVFKLDCIQPKIYNPPVTSSGDSIYKKERNILLNVDDEDSGVSSVFYQWQNSLTYDENSWIPALNKQIVSTPFNVTGQYYLHIKVEDYAGNIKTSKYFCMLDNSPPEIDSPQVLVEGYDKIRITGGARDNEVELHDTPFLFFKNGLEVSDWQSENFIDDGLMPNTKYTYKFKARDILNNVSDFSEEISKYTLALNPVKLIISDKTENSLKIIIENDERNGSTPENKIEVKLKGAGKEGENIAVLDFSKIEERIITGLNPNKDYEVWVTTRNGDLIENDPVKFIENVRTNTFSQLEVTTNGIQEVADEEGKTIVSICGKAFDEDGDFVKITATLNGVTKSIEFKAPTLKPLENNWCLNWDVIKDSLEEGEYTEIVIKIDDGTSIREKLFTGIIKIDRTSPSIKVTEPTEEWINNDIYLNIDYSDNSKIKSAFYKITASPEKPAEGWEELNCNQVVNNREGYSFLHVLVTDINEKSTYLCKGPYKIDKTSPEIKLLGSDSLTLEVFCDYEEEGVEVSDNLDDFIDQKVKISGNVDTEKIGEYLIKYWVVDEAGNISKNTSRKVQVIDSVPPQLTLIGEDNVIVPLENDFIDPGAFAFDSYDGDITDKIVVDGSVNTQKEGIYFIKYNVIDSSNNNAPEKVRKVIVVKEDKENVEDEENIEDDENIENEKEINLVKNHWAEEDINILLNKGIIRNLELDNCNLNEKIKYKEAVDILSNIFGNKESLNLFKNLNINDFITREEMAQIAVKILKSYGKKVDVNYLDEQIYNKRFQDLLKVKSSLYKDMLSALKFRIIRGMSKEEIKPKTFATKAQFLVVLNRVLMIKGNY